MSKKFSEIRRYVDVIKVSVNDGVITRCRLSNRLGCF